MKHADVDTQASQLLGLLGAAAVIYWRPDEWGAALTLGCAPFGCIGSAFRLPQAKLAPEQEIILTKGKEAQRLSPLALQRWLREDVDAALFIQNGHHGGVIAVWSASCALTEQDQPRAKALGQFALTSLRVKSTLVQSHRLASSLGSSRQVMNIADAMPQGIVLVPEPNSPGYVNHAAAALLDLPPGAVGMEQLSTQLGLLAQRALNTKDVQAQIQTLLASADDRMTAPCVWHFPSTPTSLRVSLSPMTAVNPNTPGGWLWLLEDVSATEADQSRLRLAASVFTSAHEGIVITDANGTIVETNGTFTEITGYARLEAIGQTLSLLREENQPPEIFSAVWQALASTGHWTGEVWNRRKSGEAYAELVTISAVRDESNVIQNFVALFSDITLEKAQRDQLQQMAHFDTLTQLPNRLLLSDRLQQALNQSQRRSTIVAVVFLDLDGFKAINDTHGHVAGDEVLKLVSQRMKAVLREGDTLARLGGDEFVAVLTDLHSVQDCHTLLTRLLQAASSPMEIQTATGTTLLQVSASVGVTMSPQDNASADVLISLADQAMYVAKQAGKNRYHVHNAATDPGGQ